METLSGYVPSSNSSEYARHVSGFRNHMPEGIKSPMTMFKHIAVIGLSAAFFVACGSKEKDADVGATASEDVASEDVEQPDTGAASTENIKVPTDEDEAGASPEEIKARRAEARRNKTADGTQSLRDRRAERLAKRGGETDIDPRASGPRAIKPGNDLVRAKTRPTAMPVDGEAEAVAVAAAKPDEAVTAKPGEAATAKPGESVGKEAAPAVDGAVAEEKPVEIAPLAGANAQGPAPMLDRVLPLAVAAEILGKDNLRDKGALPGIAAVGGYNSVYYDVTGKDYGVAVQIWRDLTPRETEDRFRRVRLQHPNADDIQSLKPLKSFYAGYFGIQSLTFARPDKMLVVTVSCGEGLCDHAALLKLAQAAQNRL